jgi:hypothetical protein
MEFSLRMVFCVLIGGEYAAVVAGGQEAHWLIDTCEILLRHHLEVPQDRRDAIRFALHACRDASHYRNRLVHEAWGTTADGDPVTVTSASRSYQVAGRSWSMKDIGAVAEAIAQAQRDLLSSVEEALGPARLEEARRLLASDTRERRP